MISFEQYFYHIIKYLNKIPFCEYFYLFLYDSSYKNITLPLSITCNKLHDHPQNP